MDSNSIESSDQIATVEVCGPFTSRQAIFPFRRVALRDSVGYTSKLHELKASERLPTSVQSFHCVMYFNYLSA